ncbi:hypothetical protein DID77_04085 [Candidatus Marinamargulisbacteria bacterium SCGC AG-439-L15]|nr:hypothetical protein DID77_04085 [Candidatus Marinamargulisbacteria bacterium SCGC AG-439-L15]
MLHTKNFGLAGGITLGVLVLVLTILGMLGLESGVFALLASLLIGYTVTLMGAIVGLIEAFVIGFIVFYGIAYVYAILEGK